ncbi:glutathione S-transferase [Microsporum canis CBS 113480]|uniref:Glutathione S-transferase n=1 Tax=Arthroderma otae (strain ATCC MYA-4605 / CBS 113480) TaxID=554155 RepID=C5FT51_ARTOC|nr:glutathione S-transferase [Microsporum canis CBS 113480]EEQ33054.1 glutathione S-transferase [Microsporum canis CBS 113480]
MKLLYQTHSPHARKALVFAHEAGIAADIEVIHQETSPMRRNPRVYTQENPLGKALRIQAVAQGLADVGIAVRWENTRRPEALRYPKLSCCLSQKLVESFDWLEKELDVQGPVHVGHIALATALSWLEFRDILLLCDFREGRPRLAAWYEAFEARPSMLATLLSGKTHD